MEFATLYNCAPITDWDQKFVPRDLSHEEDAAPSTQIEPITKPLPCSLYPNQQKIQSTRAWALLSQWLDPANPDAAYWWRATGVPLAVMMEHASYDTHAQYTSLLFYLHHIVNRLGPRPTTEGLPQRWRSFMTDDFSPIEYSWTWDFSPKVRYAIEAIGPSAGTCNDLFNQISTLELVNELKFVRPELDWRLFDLLQVSFNAVDGIPEVVDYATSPTGGSSFMLAFEFGHDGIGVKAYMIPTKARMLGRKVLDVATKSVEDLQKVGIKLPAYTQVLKLLASGVEGSELTFLAVSVDCVNPIESRFKLYVRCSRTSFKSVSSVLALGHKDHPTSWTGDLLAQLRDLWFSVLGLEDGFSDEKDLPTKEHQTSGVLYNIDVKPGNHIADTKVYIPVKHYGKDDWEIARGLSSFLKKQGNDKFVDNFLKMLQSVCAHRSLESGRGLQTYISCGVKKGSLSLTSYLGPEIYHKRRFRET